jgi:glutamine synthetase
MPFKDAFEMAKKNKAEIVDFKFIDLPGLRRYFSMQATELPADI